MYEEIISGILHRWVLSEHRIKIQLIRSENNEKKTLQVIQR